MQMQAQSDEKSYRISLFGIDILSAFYLHIAAIVVFTSGASYYLNAEIAGLVFLGGFIAIAIGPALYSGLPTAFERKRKVLYTCGGYYIHVIFQPWNPLKIVSTFFFYMLIYEDAIEIRALFNSYLIPLNRLKGPPMKKWHHLGQGFTIEVDLPDVPPQMKLYLLNPDRAIAQIIQICNMRDP